MSSPSTVYRHFVLDGMADSLWGTAFDDVGRLQQSLACRRYGKVVAIPTTVDRDFVIQDDVVSIASDRPMPVLRQPESELPIFVRSKPHNVRRVKVRILSRTIGVPNPILPDLGE